MSGLIGTSPALKRKLKQGSAQNKKKQDEVVCDGMRFSGQWTNLPGMLVSPYKFEFGGKWLQIQASVQVADRKGIRNHHARGNEKRTQGQRTEPRMGNGRRSTRQNLYYIILDRDFALADCRVALMVCSARNTSDKFASCRFAVVQDTLYGVQSWQNAAWVLGSAGRTRPPTPAPQLAKETS